MRKIIAYLNNKRRLKVSLSLNKRVYLTDTLVGVLKNDYDDKNVLKERYESNK